MQYACILIDPVANKAESSGLNLCFVRGLIYNREPNCAPEGAVIRLVSFGTMNFALWRCFGV